MKQFFISFRSDHFFEFNDDEFIDLSILKAKLSEVEGIPVDQFKLEIEHKEIKEESNEILFSNNTKSTLFINAVFIHGIYGGKGGFGAALRRAAKQSGPKKTTDFGACRDLSGRRIRHVNDEIILRKWQEAKDRGEEFNVDEETQSGIKLWFLPTPSWTEGFGKKPKTPRRKAKRKTELCKDWARAHEKGRFVPPSAPAWWGCPRGNRCDFAHGEEDMEKDSRKSVQERRKEESLQNERDALNSYLDPIYGDHDAGEDIVMAGLKRVSKRARTAAVTSTSQDIPISTQIQDQAHGVSTEKLADVSSEHNSEDEEDDEMGVHSDFVSIDPSPPTVESQCSWLRLLTGDALVLPSGEVRGQEEFSTVQASHFHLQGPGCWYYEVELVTCGLMQVGWACTGFEPSALGGDGVGDHPRSWAYDGFRVLRWNVNPVQYGELIDNSSGNGNGNGNGDDDNTTDPAILLQKHQWKSGDIIGCCLQVTDYASHVLIRMTFSRNGQSLGDAFYFDLKESILSHANNENVSVNASSIHFFPALSVDSNQIALVNFGQQPFKYESPLPASQPIFKKDSERIVDNIMPNNDTNKSSDSIFLPITLESSQYSTWNSLVPFGLDHLKHELSRRGLKCGGTLEERAKRLFSIRGLSDHEISSSSSSVKLLKVHSSQV